MSTNPSPRRFTHTSHPCRNPDCESEPRWVLTDPTVDNPTMGYDAIRANRTEYRVLVGVVSRSFGAARFDTEADAVAWRDEMIRAAEEAPEGPVGIDPLVRSVPTPWGSVHRTR